MNQRPPITRRDFTRRWMPFQRRRHQSTSMHYSRQVIGPAIPNWEPSRGRPVVNLAGVRLGIDQALHGGAREGWVGCRGFDDAFVGVVQELGDGGGR